VTLSNVQKGLFFACAFFANAGLAASAWTSHAQNAPSTAPAPAATATTASEPVLATYQGGSIKSSDLERVIGIKVLPIRAQIAADPERKKELLKQLIDFELLLLEAQRRGYGDHPNVKMEGRKASVDALILGPLTVAPESVSKADIDAAYAARSSEFNKPAQRRARHVVLPTEAEAVALIAEARKAGADGAQVLMKAARERSVDAATKRQSGELGYFAASGERVNGKGSIPAELAKAAFALRKDGEIAAKPVPTAGGFSVLMLVSTVAPYIVPRDQADMAVAEKLAAQRSEAAVDALIAELRKSHGAETHPERADAITLDATKGEDIPQGFPAAPIDPTAPPEIQEPDGI
jgi:peptidyl-prolyl cis-trans isomerase C